MTAYMISYDLRKQRNYDPLIKQLRDWGCISPLKSLWFGNLTGSASAVRDALATHLDSDDGLIVLEIKPQSGWATRALTDSEKSLAWIRANIKN